VILNSALDRPWSQYFCCMLIGNADYARRDPIATKRVVRAMMRATDICTDKPDWAARRLVDRGFTPRYDSAWEGLDDVSYRAWREYDTEDAVRFWALRLREIGMIKSSPDKIIATGTDFSFLRRSGRSSGFEGCRDEVRHRTNDRSLKPTPPAKVRLLVLSARS